MGELLRIERTVELQGPDGRLLGRFKSDGLIKLPAGVRSPCTDEQLVELRMQRDGRLLAYILADLKERA